MKSFIAVLLAGALALVGTQESRATLLYLTPPAGSPDFFAGYMNVSYNSGTGLFQASGTTIDYANGSATLMDVGEYTLSATITSAGVLTSGDLTIRGDITGSGVETLLTGTLNTGSSGTAFGFDNAGGDIFEFLFTVTGVAPSIVADFGGIGTPNCGVILDANFEAIGGFNGSWASDFSNNGNGNAVSDNFAPVPEPTTGCLLGVGIVAWAITLRRSDRRRAAVTR